MENFHSLNFGWNLPEISLKTIMESSSKKDNPSLKKWKIDGNSMVKERSTSSRKLCLEKRENSLNGMMNQVKKNLTKRKSKKGIPSSTETTTNISSLPSRKNPILISASTVGKRLKTVIAMKKIPKQGGRLFPKQPIRKLHCNINLYLLQWLKQSKDPKQPIKNLTTPISKTYSFTIKLMCVLKWPWKMHRYWLGNWRIWKGSIASQSL